LFFETRTIGPQFAQRLQHLVDRRTRPLAGFLERPFARAAIIHPELIEYTHGRWVLNRNRTHCLAHVECHWISVLYIDIVLKASTLDGESPWHSRACGKVLQEKNVSSPERSTVKEAEPEVRHFRRVYFLRSDTGGTEKRLPNFWTISKSPQPRYHPTGQNAL
jgi:hypothetical protein